MESTVSFTFPSPIYPRQCQQTETEPGDGFDNDCDGAIDEEDKNGRDDDGDGKIDEDLKLVTCLMHE